MQFMQKCTRAESCNTPLVVCAEPIILKRLGQRQETLRFRSARAEHVFQNNHINRTANRQTTNISRLSTHLRIVRLSTMYKVIGEINHMNLEVY